MKLIFDQKHSIIDFFKNRPEVAGAYLYGSQAKGTAGPLSDVDIAVLITSETPHETYLQLQLDYIKNIQSILGDDLSADVKIIQDNQALIYQASIINQGELIVNNCPNEVKTFIDRTGMLYPDFYPVLKQYYSRMYERLEKGTYAA